MKMDKIIFEEALWPPLAALPQTHIIGSLSMLAITPWSSPFGKSWIYSCICSLFANKNSYSVYDFQGHPKLFKFKVENMKKNTKAD